MAESTIPRQIAKRILPITFASGVSAQVADMCVCAISGDVITLTLSVFVTKPQTTTPWYSIVNIPSQYGVGANIYIPWYTFNATDFKGTVLIPFDGNIQISNQEALDNQILRFTATWVKR